jgi:hypothetical protein
MRIMGNIFMIKLKNLNGFKLFDSSGLKKLVNSGEAPSEWRSRSYGLRKG